MVMLSVCTAVIAAVAAARSTWSPCGHSMLSTITPLAERARGHRYRTTVAWFVTGSVVGGTTLGLCMALLAVGVRATGASTSVLVAVACVASVVAAAAEAGFAGLRLPVHRRQVNERWLDQFRPWVYGAGFGWQIGTGVVTYIKTTAVYLMIVLAALTTDPWVALGVGALFGTVRGLAVLLGRRITSSSALAEFHRRFSDFAPVALRITIAAELVVALVLGATLSPWAALVLVVPLGVAGGGRLLRRDRPVPATRPGDSRSARTA
jgi:hypothetical protein